MRIIDQYATWYIPTILMLAGIVWFFTGSMERAIAMLIVACPCTLILATPTAMVAALACAARLGILVKSVNDLEAARKMTAVVIDKTGTLTTGELAVSRLKPAPGVDPAEFISMAASLENRSRHPVARAVVNIAQKAKVTLKDPADFEEVAGQGVRGKLDGNINVMVGRRKWIEDQGGDFSTIAGEEFQEPEGVSVLYVARDGKCIGWVGMEDRTRPEARGAIDELRTLGIKRLAMVTGDRRSVARRVAAEMGCTEVQAEILPQQKLELVDELRSEGHRVIVVGDGVNDAPALAAGDLGVAMGAAGSDVAIHTASIALLSSDLSRLPFLIKLSRNLINVVRQNYAFAILFIIVTLILTGMGILPIIPAVILHTLSSAFVVFNSARIVRYGEELGAVATESAAGKPRAQVAAA